MPRTWIGSLGTATDLWVLTHAACYEEGHDLEGHRWAPPAEVAQKMALADGAFDSGFLRDPEISDQAHDTVPWNPGCKKCRQVGKRFMEKRGLTRDQIQRLFTLLGAKWEWTSRDTDAKRRESDKGEAIVDPDGPGVILDSTLRQRRNRRLARIARQDAKPAPFEPVVAREAIDRLAQFDKQ